MNPTRTHRKSRNRLLSRGLCAALAACSLCPASARAGDGEAGGYQRIEPKPPNPDLSAVVIATLCETLKADRRAAGTPEARPDAEAPEDKPCPDLATALAFCENPLECGNPRPPATTLDQLVKGRCPSRQPVEALGVGAKAADKLFGVGWQDAVIQGLAAFLVERAKAEALAAAAERFREGLCGEEVAKKILPLTCTLLAAADPYAVPLSWGAVKMTAERDLHDLPLRILDLGIPRVSKDGKDAGEILYASVDVLERVMAEKQAVLPLLAGLRAKYQDAAPECAKRPNACGLLAAGIVSEVALQGYDPQNPPAGFVAVAARMILDEAMAAGLVRAGADGEMTEKLRYGLGGIVGLLGQVESKALAARAASAKPAALGAYAASLAALLSRLGKIGAELTQRETAAEGQHRAVHAWPILFQASLDKDYLTAVLQLHTMLYAVMGERTPPWVGRYLPALAELAQAQSAEQVKDVLQAIAAPVGSYRGKRGAGNRLTTINGYLGLLGGFEWLGGDVPRARSLQGGIFAPIGVESSWGFGQASSLGVLLTVLDLGAVASFRTSSDGSVRGSGGDAATVDQRPEIGFAQIFSPGIYGLWGIASTPLVLGLGACMTPELRRVSTLATGTTEKAAAFRVGAFLAIDVTILPF